MRRWYLNDFEDFGDGEISALDSTCLGSHKSRHSGRILDLKEKKESGILDGVSFEREATRPAAGFRAGLPVRVAHMKIKNSLQADPCRWISGLEVNDVESFHVSWPAPSPTDQTMVLRRRFFRPLTNERIQARLRKGSAMPTQC
jgi:hypothetical protein